MGSSLEGAELQPLVANNLKWKNKIIMMDSKILKAPKILMYTTITFLVCLKVGGSFQAPGT